MGRTIKSSEIELASRTKAEIESVIVVRSALQPHKINYLNANCGGLRLNDCAMRKTLHKSSFAVMRVEPTISVLLQITESKLKYH